MFHDTGVRPSDSFRPLCQVIFCTEDQKQRDLEHQFRQARHTKVVGLSLTPVRKHNGLFGGTRGIQYQLEAVNVLHPQICPDSVRDQQPQSTQSCLDG